ncbi:MAG: histidine phosphatase family protein [Myxococcota bacterium]
MATRTVDLIRHGQYGPDGELTPLGVEQIERLAARYRDEGAPTKLWVSPQPRAQHTGRILAAAFDLEPRTIMAIAEAVPSRPDPPPKAFADFPEESIAKGRARLDKILAKLVKRARGTDRHMVLACHGNVTRYLWTRALGLDPLAWWTLSIHNGSLTRFRVHADGRIKGIRFNDVGHLPSALQTEA